jgi:hypothetical protein
MKIPGFALAVLTLAVFAAGCGPAPDYSKPIATAMDGRQQAYAKATTTIVNQGRTIVTVSLPDFDAAMRQLDVSDCPGDFRAAWTGYLNTLQDRVQKEPILRYVSLGGARGKWEISLDDNGMDFRSAWEQLDDAAEKYKPPQP